MSSYSGISKIIVVNPYASGIYTASSENGTPPNPPQDTFLEDENNAMITIDSDNGEGILVI